MRRTSCSELMDQLSADEVLLAESLADLAWLNRCLGGAATVLHQLGRLLADFEGRELSVLDVGAGGGDILAGLSGWCGARDLGFRAVALDMAPATARIAAANLRGWGLAGRVRVVRAAAARLPFGGRSFDVALCSTFLHHLDPDEAVICLTEMKRVSDWGGIVSDLRRGPAGYLAAVGLARTIWRRHRYARHDGPASVRAAYTLREARELARYAGLDAAVEAQPGFRWALRWRRAR